MLDLKLDTWLYGKLKNIAGIDGRVYESVAPVNSKYPLIVFSTIDAAPVYQVGMLEAMQGYLVVVKAVGSGSSFTGLESIADAINGALHKGCGSVNGCVILASRLEEPLKYYEITESVRYNHLGGRYKIYAQGA